MTVTAARAAAIAAYAAVVVLANVLTSRYGLVPVGFGLIATAGTYCAGAALGLRDLVQETWSVLGVVVAIALGAALSFAFADPHVAAASCAAFAIAELCDLAVYTPLRRRGWSRAVLASNVVGALVDTIVFLYVAGFPVVRDAVAGQLVVKILWMTAVPLALIAIASRARPARA